MARRGLGSTSPNPAVGCVIVKDNAVIGRGYHRGTGLPHAEVEALSDAGEAAKGADLYVSLEPCNHHGRTPPCTEAILRAGIKRVVFSAKDPNPEVEGNGAARLRAEGLEVIAGILPETGEHIIEGFRTGFAVQRPFVTLKLALTADRKLSTGDPSRRWISSPIARAFVQRLRSRTDAILVGSGTVKADDPALTNRLGRGAQPLRVIIGDASPFDRHLQVFDSSAKTIVLPGFDLESALAHLFDLGIRTVLCEGGAEIARSLITEQLVNRLILIEATVSSSGEALPEFPLHLEQGFKAVLSRRMGPDTVRVLELA